MGLFDFFGKRDSKPTEGVKKTQGKKDVGLAFAIFDKINTPNESEILSYLDYEWNLKAEGVTSDKGVIIFTINKARVVIAFMPVPIPKPELENLALVSYLWPKASEAVESHNSQAMISVISDGNSPLENMKLLAKVIGSVLSTSPALGVYIGSQSLLLSREYYLDSLELMKEADGLPIAIFVYIGLIAGEGVNDAYTFGLKSFGKKDLEILNSKKDIENLHELLFDMSAYVVKSNVTIKPGETVGRTAEEKIVVSKAKGEYTNEEVLRLHV